MERVCRRPGHRLPQGRILTDPSPLLPDDIRRWQTYVHDSPLYHQLATVIAADPELMRLINRIEHTPRPNMLLAAVQYLLKQQPGDPLASFYPGLTTDPRPLAGIDSHFSEFVLRNEKAIVEIGRTRYTQTNECRRCVALVPAVMSSGLPSFHLIDIGTSAGLNLAMDRYAYRWGTVDWGESTLLLETESRGVDPAKADFTVLSRTGLDLNPIDAADPDERSWLEALIWPEHHSRRRRLLAALELVAEVPISFVRGDAELTLPDTLSSLPVGQPAIVINSFAMNQFGKEQRQAVEAIVEEARAHRPIRRVSLEIYTSKTKWADLRVDDGAGWVELGQAHPHGDWIELYARP